MSQNATTKGLDLQNKTEAELNEIANNITKKYGPPKEYYSAKNTHFGWTDDGKGVWILPMTKVNSDRFEEIARTFSNLGHDDLHAHNEIMKLAGAEFFADWRDSAEARAVKEIQACVREEDNEADRS